jgi:hypothetical protein
MHLLIQQFTKTPAQLAGFLGFFRKILHYKQPTTSGDQESVDDPDRSLDKKIAPWATLLRCSAVIWIICILLIPLTRSDAVGLIWLFGLGALLFLEGVASNRVQQLKRLSQSLRRIAKSILGGIATILELFKLIQRVMAVSYVPQQLLCCYTNRFWIWNPTIFCKNTAQNQRPAVQPTAPTQSI